jgi:hypothetical protein
LRMANLLTVRTIVRIVIGLRVFCHVSLRVLPQASRSFSETDGAEV